MLCDVHVDGTFESTVSDSVPNTSRNIDPKVPCFGIDEKVPSLSTYACVMALYVDEGSLRIHEVVLVMIGTK